MAKGSKFYVVWKGAKPGIYSNWDECKDQVMGYVGAQYKSFSSREEAEHAYTKSIHDYVDFTKKNIPKKHSSNLAIIQNSICVDAACSGNPGIMEYRGVDLVSGVQIFHQGPFKDGTNNIGEFLALVHGIAYLLKNNLDKAIYTDSITAISWVKAKKAKTKLTINPHNQELFNIIAKAEAYLSKTTHSIKIIKWETESWGEIPADFGRK